jgi:hypothetical protein
MNESHALHSPFTHPGKHQFLRHLLATYYTSSHAQSPGRDSVQRLVLTPFLGWPMPGWVWGSKVPGDQETKRARVREYKRSELDPQGSHFCPSPQGATVSLSETVQKWREYRRQCQRFLIEAPPPATGESRWGPHPQCSHPDNSQKALMNCGWVPFPSLRHHPL